MHHVNPMLHSVRDVHSGVAGILLILLMNLLITTVVHAGEVASEARESPMTIAGPDWARTLAVYQVNQGQYKYPDGQFLTRFTEQHLPVLKDMGVGMIWLMPIHPRGGWGSAYCITDFYGIDPKWGTKADFDRLVKRAHELEMRVILDWVPNHTSFDHPLIRQRPDMYRKTEDGQISTVGPWKDIAQLDWDNPEVWDYQRDAMAHWVKEHNIDGFRMDVAGRVPTEFWNWLRPQLNEIREVFMLAEDNRPDHHPAFDMSYDWDLPLALWDIAAGTAPATAIDEVLSQESRFPDGAIRMRFLSNHDWHHTPNPGNYHALYGKRLTRMEGETVMQRYGRGAQAFMVLCATLPGKPLVYNGQEMGDGFHRPGTPEAIQKSPHFKFYQQLLSLYRDHPAIHQGRMIRLATDVPQSVYAFARQHGEDRVIVVLNLSDQSHEVVVDAAAVAPESQMWVELFTQTSLRLPASIGLTLEPWAYRVFVK